MIEDHLSLEDLLLATLDGLGGFADALGRQVVSLARRQLGGAVAHSPDDAFGHQAGQGSVDRGVRLTENECQLRRIDERRPADGVEQLSVREGHKLRVAKESPDGQPSRVSIGVWEGIGRCSLG